MSIIAKRTRGMVFFQLLKQLFISSEVTIHQLYNWTLINRRKIERYFALMEEKLGGEEQFLDKYIGLYTEKIAGKKFNSTILCFTFHE